jgi:hypothetical protein
MARQGKGILDVPRGSLANVTGYKSLGADILKTKNTNTPKTQTPALIQSKKDWAFSMRLYNLIKNSQWWPYLNKDIVGKSFMNHIMSFNKLINSKVDISDYNVNILGKQGFSQKYEVIFRPTGFPYRIRINAFNTPTSPGALANDRVFLILYESYNDFLGIYTTSTQTRGTFNPYAIQRNIPPDPNIRIFYFLAFFRNDFSAYSNQLYACISNY